MGSSESLTCINVIVVVDAVTVVVEVGSVVAGEVLVVAPTLA